MGASYKGHVDIVRLLIEAKAQLNTHIKKVFCKRKEVGRDGKNEIGIYKHYKNDYIL